MTGVIKGIWKYFEVVTGSGPLWVQLASPVMVYEMQILHILHSFKVSNDVSLGKLWIPLQHSADSLPNLEPSCSSQQKSKTSTVRPERSERITGTIDISAIIFVYNHLQSTNIFNIDILHCTALYTLHK